MVVFVYQGYRDTIDKFHGKFNTLEEAENHIYEDLVKEVQDFLDMMQQKRDGTYVSPLTQMFKGDKEGKIERNGLEYYEKILSELEERDNEITEDGLKSEKYYQNRDWKGEIKRVSQTPKGSIQQSGSWSYDGGMPPMYQGYSQRYEDGSGNYPYIIFDPSFVPSKSEMKEAEYSMLGGIREEFKDAESNLSEATLKRLRKTYDNYEERNEHMSNYLLLATFFGTDEDKEEVKKIMARRNRRGYLTQKESTWLYENINPYYDHLRNVKAAETFDADERNYLGVEVSKQGDKHYYLELDKRFGELRYEPNWKAHGWERPYWDLSIRGGKSMFVKSFGEGVKAFKRETMKAETFDVEFNEWADQEMLTHGQDISFRDWAKEEGEKHGDMDLTDWAKDEEESHDERYGAETFGAERMHGDDRLDRWVEDNYGEEFDWVLLGEFDGDSEDAYDILENFIVLDDEGNEYQGIAIVYRETFGAESKKKGYGGWINGTTSYRKGGSAGSYNIFENDKYRTSVGVNDFKKMVIAESRFKKDWKDVVLDADRRVWPQTYDKKHPEKFVKLPFSDYTWRHGDVAKKNAETFGADSDWNDDTKDIGYSFEVVNPDGDVGYESKIYKNKEKAQKIMNNYLKNMTDKKKKEVYGEMNVLTMERNRKKNSGWRIKKIDSIAGYGAETFGAESKKTKYGMIAAGVITAFALIPEIKKRF